MTMDSEKKESSLIEFPALFPIKVIGNNTESFPEEVSTAIRSVYPDFSPTSFASEYSKNKKYLSLTATVFVTSQEQLDAIYRAITALENAKFVL